MEEEELYKTMKASKFKVDEDLSPQQVIGKQREQEMERIAVLKNIKKRCDLLKYKHNRYIVKPVVADNSKISLNI
jgi:hypothetical protein